MVGIVIACHSKKLVDNFIEFLEIFKTEDFELLNASDPKIDLGTSVEYMIESIKKANKGKGVLVILDLGSTIDCAKQAKEKLKGQIDVEISNAPFLEGAITAVAANDETISLKQLKRISEDSINFKKVK